MKTRFRIDGQLLECTSESLESTYFRVRWTLRRADCLPSAQAPQGESYVCRALTEAEAQQFVLARARLMSGLLLEPAHKLEQDEPDSAINLGGNVPPDAPVVSGR
ncbi:hypothetical protein C0Q88_12315 [Ralstonia pickettii]|uniref:Uncharacterized protein n=2 Tax=Ralstonia pickettii TaxID=329 RepID=A0A2N4TSW1_RALPI|nr:hypothetical protein C0Q88_12315 [Ralstonia pickettii]